MINIIDHRRREEGWGNNVQERIESKPIESVEVVCQQKRKKCTVRIVYPILPRKMKMVNTRTDFNIY